MASGDNNFLLYLNGRTQTFNPYAAGEKVYEGGRSSPNLGPTANREGYEERDRKAKARRNALLRKMQAGQQGRPMSAPWLKRRTYGQ